MTDNSGRVVHEAAKGYASEGEIVVNWVMTLEIARPDGGTYLAHRSGGGIDGDENPSIWAALGMLEASVDLARCQLRECSDDADDD